MIVDLVADMVSIARCKVFLRRIMVDMKADIISSIECHGRTSAVSNCRAINKKKSIRIRSYKSWRK